MPTDDQHWTLDKKVPVAVIATVLVQFAAVIWMASRLNADVTELQRADARIEMTIRESRMKIDQVDNARSQVEMRLIRVEEQAKQIYDTIKSVDKKLDRIEDRNK